MTARDGSVDVRQVSAASRRGRSARVKGRVFAGEVRKAWEAAIGKVVVPAQEADADDLIDPVNGISVECKNRKALALASWVDQARSQADARGGLLPVVVHKRAGTTDPGRWYVTMEFSVLAALLKRAQR